MQEVIKIHATDNVAVALADLTEGQLIEMKRAEELRRRSQEGGLTPDEKDELQRLDV